MQKKSRSWRASRRHAPRVSPFGYAFYKFPNKGKCRTKNFAPHTTMHVALSPGPDVVTELHDGDRMMSVTEQY